jgi:hypothetical protein
MVIQLMITIIVTWYAFWFCKVQIISEESICWMIQWESILEIRDVLKIFCHIRTTPETESMFSATGRHKPDAFPGCQRIPILNSVGKDSTK